MDVGAQSSISMQDGIPVVRIGGTLDHTKAPEFRTTVSHLVDNGSKRIVIDMSAVDFIDSGGISGIIFAVKRLSAEGGHLFLANCSAHTARKLEIGGLTRLSDLLTVCASVEEAVNAAHTL